MVLEGGISLTSRCVICPEKDSSSSISRRSSLTFITLVNKLPLQVISKLLFILVESRFPFTERTLVFFFDEWKPVGQCPVKDF